VKYSTFSKSVFAVTAILVAAACANSADVPTTTDEPEATEPPPSSKVPPAPAPTTKPDDKKCAPSCKTDSDCTNSCPALAGGVQCCDTATNTCWGSKTSACPKPADPADAGEPPPAY